VLCCVFSASLAPNNSIHTKNRRLLWLTWQRNAGAGAGKLERDTAPEDLAVQGRGLRAGAGGGSVWDFMLRFDVYMKHTCATYFTTSSSSSNPFVCKNMHFQCMHAHVHIYIYKCYLNAYIYLFWCFFVYLSIYILHIHPCMCKWLCKQHTHTLSLLLVWLVSLLVAVFCMHSIHLRRSCLLFCSFYKRTHTRNINSWQNGRIPIQTNLFSLRPT